MTITVELEQKANGHWVAAIAGLPGIEVEGNTQREALQKAQELALRREIVARIDAAREALFAKLGPMSDSTSLIREDRDR